ncbi:death domain-containing protein 1 [Gouania willdenowi]|uniref:death domain-containing protein 1 n=1 Tax=Gouania willdenowi TaxID=441366 RepID=UPI001055A5B2|nr:death domain-containing protein 1 [Gouania willdenowi]
MGSKEEVMLGPQEDQHKDEKKGSPCANVGKECQQKILEVLKELRVFNLEKLAHWKETFQQLTATVKKSPTGGEDEHPEMSDSQEVEVNTYSDSTVDCFQSVAEDIEHLMETLSTVITKIDTAFLQLCAGEDFAGTLLETKDRKATVQKEHMEAPNHCIDGLDSGSRQEYENEGDQSQHTSDSGLTSTNIGSNWTQIKVKDQSIVFEEKPNHCQTDLLKETEKKQESMTGKSKDTKSDWITVGLSGQQEDTLSGVPDSCFIKAPVEAIQALRSQVVDNLSCLVVSGPEELLSRVIQIKVPERENFPFPVMVALPFHTRYRGAYRDITVKIVDEERKVSYVRPVTTEGIYGGRKGSFAQVKVYTFGLFAVVSCLRKESYTVPKRGLSHKLVMDPRICLKYLSGSFTAPVIAQTMIQPIEAVLLTAAKSRNDAFRSVVSTSPLLYLAHPSSQILKRPFSVTLPCPPNPDKKRGATRKSENQEPLTVNVGASLNWDHPVTERLSILGVSTKSQEMSNESLIALGFKDEQWSALDKVVVRNQQNGLVSFDLTEKFERLIVIRLLSQVPPCVLTSLAEELEASVCCHSVTVVLQRRLDEPHTVLVAVVPSRDLNWEINKLKARGYNGGSVECSPEFCMCEADLLVLRFTGNITSTAQNKDNMWMAFHSQRKNHLQLHVIEVDQFGNYSSPHYKGTVLFHKVTRGQLEWQGEGAILKDTKLLGDPVCRLSLTLPKKVRKIDRPTASRVKLCEVTDSLSDSLLLWLSGELSEEEVSLLVPLLRLRRSSTQLVKLRAGNHLSSQVFHILLMWRRGLPTMLHRSKASQLAKCLVRSGRPDLAHELLLRQDGNTGQK